MRMEKPDLELTEDTDMTIFVIQIGSGFQNFRVTSDGLWILDKETELWKLIGDIDDGRLKLHPNPNRGKLSIMLTCTPDFAIVRQAWRNSHTGRWAIKAKPAF